MYTYYRLKWYACAVLMVVGFLTVVGFFSWSERQLGLSPKVVPPKASSRSVAPPTSNSLNTASAINAAEISEQIAQANRLLDEATDFQASAVTAAVTWQTDIEPFREIPAGKLATDDAELPEYQKLVEQMAFVTSANRPSPEQLAKVALRIENLKGKTQSLADHSNPSPLKPSELTEIITIHNASKQASEAWTLALQQATAIKHKLGQQIMATEAEAEQPETVGDKIMEAEISAVLEDLDAQIERDEAAKILERERAEEAQALVAEATRPEVSALLAPFLTRHYVQPREMAGTTLRFKKTVDEGPISLTALNGINALADTEAGL
ncbi:MAG: hypothetical protein KDB22_30260, partial [Planctomycetales bacterium]|nr:hypothetical protein [Planctomycetales bacterium]